jgi:DNA modification methylase
MAARLPEPAPFTFGRQSLHLADCLPWLAEQPAESISAVVTDPPYGLVEYNKVNQAKLRKGRGGVWRIPPAFDGSNRKPLPRFTVLSTDEREAIRIYFEEWGAALLPVLKPGAHVLIAGNALVSPLVAEGMEMAGYERRGEIVRLVRTFRGGDRPKFGHDDYPEVSTMPRSLWEPWGLYRKPIAFRQVRDNLEAYGTGALRRPAADTPFADVFRSGITPRAERDLAPHPSVKPQAFLRAMVRAMLPLGAGVVLDTFAGCATTLAACEAMGIDGVGVERDPRYYQMACAAIPRLAALVVSPATPYGAS